MSFSSRTAADSRKVRETAEKLTGRRAVAIIRHQMNGMRGSSISRLDWRIPHGRDYRVCSNAVASGRGVISFISRLMNRRRSRDSTITLTSLLHDTFVRIDQTWVYDGNHQEGSLLVGLRYRHEPGKPSLDRYVPYRTFRDGLYGYQRRRAGGGRCAW